MEGLELGNILLISLGMTNILSSHYQWLGPNAFAKRDGRGWGTSGYSVKEGYKN
jgi:hypothetical protein